MAESREARALLSDESGELTMSNIASIVQHLHRHASDAPVYQHYITLLAKAATKHLSAVSESTPAWRPIALLPNDRDDHRIFIVRDKDGQMSFAVWTKQYGWEHVADDDCGAAVEWYPLPESRLERDGSI